MKGKPKAKEEPKEGGESESLEPKSNEAAMEEVKYRLLIKPAEAHSYRGGGSFRTAQGHGNVFLKCEEKIPNNKLKFRFFFGAPNKKGEYQHFSAGIDHDFSKNLTGGLEKNADWDFKTFVDRGVLTIGAEAVSQEEGVEIPASWARQDGGGTSGVGGTATIKDKKKTTRKMESGEQLKPESGVPSSTSSQPMSGASSAPKSGAEGLGSSAFSPTARTGTDDASKETFQY